MVAIFLAPQLSLTVMTQHPLLLKVSHLPPLATPHPIPTPGNISPPLHSPPAVYGSAQGPRSGHWWCSWHRQYVAGPPSALPASSWGHHAQGQGHLEAAPRPGHGCSCSLPDLPSLGRWHAVGFSPTQQLETVLQCVACQKGDKEKKKPV